MRKANRTVTEGSSEPLSLFLADGCQAGLAGASWMARSVFGLDLHPHTYKAWPTLCWHSAWRMRNIFILSCQVGH